MGIRSVATFEPRNGGESWTTENRNLRAGFLSDPHSETGHCIHHLVRDSAGDGRIFHQNHCGTNRRGPDCGTWTEITKGLPSDFGFADAADPLRPHAAHVASLIGGEHRVPPKTQLAVGKTTNAGRTWTPSTKGLPGPGAYMGVLREAMATDANDPVGAYLGTNTGQLYARRDAGA